MLKRPVIIGNAPSSGSTLLANLFGRIPATYRPDELSIFDKSDWLQADADTFQRNWRSWFRKGYRRRLGCEMRVLFTHYRAPLPEPRPGEDYLSFLLRFMDERAVEAQANRWVEKTPANIFAFPTLVERLPEAVFVIIHRDARSVISSLIRRGYTATFAAALWYLANLAAHSVANNPGVKSISYEELVQSPEQVLRELFDFVGEDVDLATLERNSAGPSTTHKSWRVLPSQPISTSALWQDGQTLPDNAAEAFTRLRASGDFIASLGLDTAPTPIELQQMLGYGTRELFLAASGGLARDRAYDVARYYGSMLRYGLIPKPLPFHFV